MTIRTLPATIDWTRWSVILLKPDCLRRGLVEEVLSKVAAEVEIVARQATLVTQTQIFAHYDDLLADPGRFHPVNVAADLRRGYVGQRVVIALGRGPAGPPDTPTRLRALLGHYDPARADPASIRGQFGIDSLATARGENRLIENLIHTSDDAEAARRDFAIWFGIHRLAALLTNTVPDRRSR